MSRRTGQDGHLEASGKWWVVRWWMDVAGQEARRHMRAKVCPISGPGHLSKSERERRAREIVVESGADTVQHFDEVVKQAHGVTFREQAKWWLDHIQRRKRKPLRPQHWNCGKAASTNGSTQTSEICHCPTSTIASALKALVAKMTDGGLSPKTITGNYVPVVKMVVASAVDESRASKSIPENGTTTSLICPYRRKISRTRHRFPPR
jgi:hypothetical protein